MDTNSALFEITWLSGFGNWNCLILILHKHVPKGERLIANMMRNQSDSISPGSMAWCWLSNKPRPELIIKSNDTIWYVNTSLPRSFLHVKAILKLNFIFINANLQWISNELMVPPLTHDDDITHVFHITGPLWGDSNRPEDSQSTVKWSFDVFIVVVSLNRQLNKQSGHQLLETLWHSCKDTVMYSGPHSTG